MAIFPSTRASGGSRSMGYRPAFSSKSGPVGSKWMTHRTSAQQTKQSPSAQGRGHQYHPQTAKYAKNISHTQGHGQQIRHPHTGQHTGSHRPRWGWLSGTLPTDGGVAPADATGGPITIDWQEPTSLDDAIGQPGAGVFIIENTEGDTPQPVQVGDAADGFAQRLQSMQEDRSGASGQQVRLGLISVRRGNRADRAVVRAAAHDIAARINASGVAGPGFPAQRPSPSEQRLLQQRPIQDGGAVPDYLAAGG
jgi:hypothetical protein